MKNFFNNKFNFKKIHSLKDLDIGDIICIKNSNSIFSRSKNNGIKKGVLVKKNKRKIFNFKETCIIYNINTISLPDDELISKIISYFNEHEQDIYNGSFEFMSKFSQGEALYLLKEKKGF